jgi:hypothetical protein
VSSSYKIMSEERTFPDYIHKVVHKDGKSWEMIAHLEWLQCLLFNLGIQSANKLGAVTKIEVIARRRHG